jgi:hypothetical protein
MTARDRSIRGLMGSATSNKSVTMLRRLRRTLERVTPYKATADDREKGLSCDAESTLARDYGLFKPPSGGDLWRADSFIVLQHDEELIEEKEPTWSAYGMDQDFLGGRYDLVIWDDLVTTQHTRTLEAVEKQRHWWDREAESRLEPGGALFLIGQRVASNDLYRHCLDKKILPDDDDAVDTLGTLTDDERRTALTDQPSLYRHIIYRAHDESRCLDEHGKDARYWPEGCLLDPYRLTWRELRAKRANDSQVYATWYQQEDADPKQSLVKPIWVSGGTDPDEGSIHPGCWDKDRQICELPSHVPGPRYSFATVDPSPSKMWACQWWVYCPEAAHSLFLMDTVRFSAPANELLDWNNNTQSWYGLMQEWQERSIAHDLKITDWIFENNAAQRWFYQFEHCARWTQHYQISVRPHTTTVRKNDTDLGIEMIRDWWKFGRIRLPGKGQSARMASLKLVEEVQRYGNAYYDDQAMACYFAVLWLPTLSAGWDITEVPKFKTPTWLRGVYSGVA